jgi:uncharacterized protein YacL
MNADQLSAVAGIVLSLAFSYLPGVSDWFARLDSTVKRLIMAALLAVVAGAVYGLSCADVLTTITCNKPGALGLLNALIAALIANQATFTLSPKAKAGLK